MNTIERLEDRIAPTVFLVTTLNDGGEGSLREAIADANAAPGKDTVLFAADLQGVMKLTAGAIGVTGATKIKGPAGQSAVIDGMDASRIFNINDGSAAGRDQRAWVHQGEFDPGGRGDLLRRAAGVAQLFHCGFRRRRTGQKAGFTEATRQRNRISA